MSEGIAEETPDVSAVCARCEEVGCGTSDACHRESVTRDPALTGKALASEHSHARARLQAAGGYERMFISNEITEPVNRRSGLMRYPSIGLQHSFAWAAPRLEPEPRNTKVLKRVIACTSNAIHAVTEPLDVATINTAGQREIFYTHRRRLRPREIAELGSRDIP